MLVERLTRDTAKNLNQLVWIVGELQKYCENEFVVCLTDVELWTDENGDFHIVVKKTD